MPVGKMPIGITLSFAADGHIKVLIGLQYLLLENIFYKNAG
jgi:hypothetical protein